MAIHVEHELHHRRKGRNIGLGLALGAFVALVFGLTMVKVTVRDPQIMAEQKQAEEAAAAAASATTESEVTQ